MTFPQEAPTYEVILKRFDQPDEIRTFDKGKFELVDIGGMTIGRATVAMDGGRIIEMKPGDLFYIAPGHDSWAVGDEPYISLHLIGAGDYAAHKPS
ncbi:MAG TPA: hypothetical protein VHX37_00020 [Acidobacteriaceae bacterium]|jgi:hypothetical protein|nr:hypothetical protein [Acidobacteriaceae bacterium]